MSCQSFFLGGDEITLEIFLVWKAGKVWVGECNLNGGCIDRGIALFGCGQRLCWGFFLSDERISSRAV